MYRILMISFVLGLIVLPASPKAQTPQFYSSSDILLSLKKLNVLGSVLYVAAHPDDENTRLLAYLAKEKLYRTGYLSLTRGDGGQNLIGNEQGIELGLIRTQELLAARRIDGAEQFFSRAYDFGFSKSTEEALKFWNKDKILADVVWVIRKFQPDVIITRFPQDSRAGHGHHSASAVLAVEAFTVAADPAAFPEQLKYVKPWQAKRVLWNLAGFGGVNPETESQLKLDVGVYNPLLGKGYGEIHAESRSQHKSQGFGVPRQRGSLIEYFSLWKGEALKKDLLDGVTTTWGRVDGGNRIQERTDHLINNYSFAAPGNSVKGLVELYKTVAALETGYWRNQKLLEIKQLIEACSGLWAEATTATAMAVQNDSLQVQFFLNNRNGGNVTVKQIKLTGFDTVLNRSLPSNINYTFNKSVFISDTVPLTQPYWLKQKMKPGYFDVSDQLLIGNADNNPALMAVFVINIEGTDFEFSKPVKQKYTDPVKGEIYQPVVVVPQVLITPEKSLIVSVKPVLQKMQFLTHAYKDIREPKISFTSSKEWQIQDSTGLAAKQLLKGTETGFSVVVKPVPGSVLNHRNMLTPSVSGNGMLFNLSLRSISYDHIPAINYFRSPEVAIINIDLKTTGKKIGYIEGAGDYVPAALLQMGYQVSILSDNELGAGNLSQFDAIITGVRAYNVKESMNLYYDKLMNYIKEGGNLIVQYNTSSQLGPVKAKIGPWPFDISRVRVSNEDAIVKVLRPQHPVLNYPNRITQKDFEGWVQERSLYHAQNWDSRYETVFSMHDPNEKEDEGSLITAKYGKGNFVYTGLVFYRELPAGVPGAYRLLANIIALNKSKTF